MWWLEEGPLFVADKVQDTNVHTLLVMFSQYLFITEYLVKICTLLLVVLGFDVSLQVVTSFKHFITCIALVKLALNAQRHSWLYQFNFVGVITNKRFPQVFDDSLFGIELDFNCYFLF